MPIIILRYKQRRALMRSFSVHTLDFVYGFRANADLFECFNDLFHASMVSEMPCAKNEIRVRIQSDKSAIFDMPKIKKHPAQAEAHAG